MPDEDLIDAPEELGEPEELICASCGSADIHKRPRALYFIVIAVLAISVGFAFGETEAAFYFVAAAAIFSMIADRWVCEECGRSWK
jgi:hypothetical protein